MGRVVGLGLCVVDHIYVVEDPRGGEPRTRYVERAVAPGGMTATALAQAAALGCDARLLSQVGDDPEGRALRRDLRALGVSTRGLVVSAEDPTTVAVVLVARRGGERRFVVPDRRALERRAPDFDLGAIRRGAVLLIDGHFPRQALRAAKRARERGVPVVADFHRPSPGNRKLLPLVDFPVMPEEFARVWAGDARKALLRLRREYGGNPVVTQGARGGIYLDGNRVRRWRAPRVAVRDTTGCGDVFHGAFAAGLQSGLDVAGSVELAARAASLCCTALGGTGRLLREADPSTS